MTEQLSERLHAAVPDPPPVDRLAERAVDAGRRRRTTKRGAGVAALMTVVAAVIAVPTLLGGDGVPAPAPLDPDDPPSTIETVECVGSGELTGMADAAGDVVAIRFCPREDGGPGIARFPEGALTGDAAAQLVAGLPADLEAEACEPRFSGRSWQVQVTMSSGDVYQRASNTRFCPADQAYRQLVAAISEELAAQYEPVAPGPLPECPDTLSLGQTNQDGASAALLTSGGAQVDQLSTTPLLALPADDGRVCEYAGTRSDRRLVDSWPVTGETAEALRLGSLLGYHDGMTDCGGDAGAASYVVVLRDVTGTARTFSIDGTECSPMSAAIGTPAQEQYLGLADPVLAELIEETRP